MESFEKFGPEYFQYLMGTDKQQVRDVSTWVMVFQGVHIGLRGGGRNHMATFMNSPITKQVVSFLKKRFKQ